MTTTINLDPSAHCLGCGTTANSAQTVDAVEPAVAAAVAVDAPKLPAAS